jgi:hypothetical protein
MLPNVNWREVVLRHIESGRIKKQPKSYVEFVKLRINDFAHDAKKTFSRGEVVKWSICWALFLCGYLQESEMF